MSAKFFSETQAYRFIKVQEYFAHYKEWSEITKVEGAHYDDKEDVLYLDVSGKNVPQCSMLVQFLQDDTVRMRFNPTKGRKDYASQNSCSVVQDSFDELKRILDAKETFKKEKEATIGKNDKIEFVSITTFRNNFPAMKVCIEYDPFKIVIYNVSRKSPFVVWQSSNLYFTQNGDDHSIIFTVKKPPTAKYIGFGEQGGQSLSKNTAQVNYFNFDNMRYMQVYNHGPLDAREPLYHSEPIFFEYNGVPGQPSAYALFVDNPGQVFMDIGYLNSSRYMFGTRFGDLDFYLFGGNSTANIIDSYTSVVGRSKLKPRYVLGYHQGCYGYDRREICEWAVQKHRDYQIPLDGLHVDVDIQKNYQTFTIDTNKFPEPHDFFANLRKKGVKCSTNITPVISCIDESYKTYTEGRDKGYFVTDERFEPDSYTATHYQLYGGGNEFEPNGGYVENNFNTGTNYLGGVYYGNDANGNELGTPGHYSNLAVQEVQEWWGRQYQYLFDSGLEMVWQDMTTPAIRDYRGDMKGFPFKLMLNNNFYKAIKTMDEAKRLPKTPAIKIWNLYSYNLHHATYNGLNKLKSREGKRNFIIGRGSYSGSHRFAGLWTGDNASDWNFLKMNVSQALSLGMCGVVINGQDIGGFESSMQDEGKWASPELLIRWTAAGAFLPWFRNHYVRKGRKQFQEPFMYTEWFNTYRNGQLPEPQSLYRDVLPICKHYIELRYRLMQLFYDCLFENTINGLPICRPLFLEAPGDQALFNDKEEFISNEFFVGKNVLVAPVLDPQILNGINNWGKRDVYLPTGCEWYHFKDNVMPLQRKVEGGTTIRDFDANINTVGSHINFIVPVYIREGAIIPTLEIEQYVGQRNADGLPNPITINVYPGQKGDYTMYLDDGVSRPCIGQDEKLGEYGNQPENTCYREVKISHQRDPLDKNVRSIIVERGHDGYTPVFEKFYFVAVLLDPQENEIKEVQANGKILSIIKDGTVECNAEALNHSAINSWYYNENIRIAFIKIYDEPKIEIKVTYKE